jgi:hypothetical protein
MKKNNLKKNTPHNKDNEQYIQLDDGEVMLLNMCVSELNRFDKARNVPETGYRIQQLTPGTYCIKYDRLALNEELEIGKDLHDEPKIVKDLEKLGIIEKPEKDNQSVTLKLKKGITAKKIAEFSDHVTKSIKEYKTLESTCGNLMQLNMPGAVLNALSKSGKAAVAIDADQQQILFLFPKEVGWTSSSLYIDVNKLKNELQQYCTYLGINCPKRIRYDFNNNFIGKSFYKQHKDNYYVFAMTDLKDIEQVSKYGEKEIRNLSSGYSKWVGEQSNPVIKIK